MKNNTRPCRVVVGLALGILVVFGSLSTVSGAATPGFIVTVTPTCTNYTISISASGLVPSANYTIDFTIIATTTGFGFGIGSSIPFTASSSGTFSTKLTNPFGPLNSAFSFSGSATLVGGNTIPITFLPSSLSCPVSPFATSSAKLEIAQQGFDLNESFTLGANSNGINPVTENVTLQIGSFSVTIPSGSFQQNHSGRFTFQGVINGLNLQVQITPLGNNIFTFKAEKFKSEGIGVDLTGLSNPVDVVLTIGNDSGSTAVTAQICKPKADQQD
jgi:hypothetical protein